MRRLMRWLMVSIMGLLTLGQPALVTEMFHFTVASTTARPSSSGPGYPGPFSSV